MIYLTLVYIYISNDLSIYIYLMIYLYLSNTNIYICGMCYLVAFAITMSSFDSKIACD
jgi:hypothetical protein